MNGNFWQGVKWGLWFVAPFWAGVGFMAWWWS